MKFSVLFILAGIGAILFAIFAGHGSSSSASTTASTAPTAPSSANRPQNYVSPLANSPAHPPMFAPTQSDNAGNATDAAATAPGPSFLSNVVNYVRQHLTSPPPTRTSWTLDDLRIARGQVAEIHEGKVFVNCQGWNVMQEGDPRLHAGDGFSASPVLGMADTADELARFGTLKAVIRGNYVSSPYNPRIWSTDRYINGQVILEDCPAGVGQRIKVVVAYVRMIEWRKNDVPVFTTAVRLDDAQTAPGAWMWQGSGDGPLDRPQGLPR